LEHLLKLQNTLYVGLAIASVVVALGVYICLSMGCTSIVEKKREEKKVEEKKEKEKTTEVELEEAPKEEK